MEKQVQWKEHVQNMYTEKLRSFSKESAQFCIAKKKLSEAENPFVNLHLSK